MPEPLPRALDALDPRRYDRHARRDVMMPFCTAVSAWLQHNRCDVCALEEGVIMRESFVGPTAHIATATARASRRAMPSARLRDIITIARTTAPFANADNADAWDVVVGSYAETIARHVAYVSECMRLQRRDQSKDNNAVDVYWLGVRRIIALNIQMRLFMIMSAQSKQ